MAKQTALGDSLYVGPYDLSGDVGALSTIGSPRAVIDVSSIKVSGYERLLGRVDGQISFNAFYDPAASHPVLSAAATVAGTANTIVSYLHGATIGNDMGSLVAKQVDYPLTIGQDGSIGVAVSTPAGGGKPVEWGVVLTTGQQTFASSGTVSTFIDSGATSTAFGAAAYLHAFSIASGTATVAVQDSADSATWADVTGLVFTAVSGATFERVATAATATIRRYYRVNVTGTFTNLVAAVNLVVYPASQT